MTVILEQLDSLLPIVKKVKQKRIPVQDHPAVTVKMEEMEIPEIVVREPVAMATATEKETADGDSQKDGKQIVVAPENSEAYLRQV